MVNDSKAIELSSRTKILHIEDDDLYASLVQLMLTDDSGASPYDIVHVMTLKEGLSQLKNNGFNAIILDLGLYHVSGLDNVRAIKSERPDLPIIVLTGHDNEHVAHSARDAGARDVIVKAYASESVIRSAITSSLMPEVA